MITQKPNYVDPKKPSEIRSFKRPDTTSESQLVFDPTRIDRIFKLKSMERRIGTGKAIPRQRCKWQQTVAQEIGWDVDPIVPKNPES